MPRARANIIAKFIAHTEMGVNLVSRSSMPAAVMRPARVSSRGSPAATSEPKARTRMARVTGHESISDFIMAAWLAALKSDHRTEDPVAVTRSPGELSAARRPDRSSAARTMLLGSVAAPPMTIAVRPSRLIETPGIGASTVPMRGTPRVADGRGRVHHHLERRARLAVEVGLGDLARPHGGGAVGLPPRAAEGALHVGREGAEPGEQDDPDDHDDPGVTRRPRAETPEGAGPEGDDPFVVRNVGVRGRGSGGGHW